MMKTLLDLESENRSRFQEPVASKEQQEYMGMRLADALTGNSFERMVVRFLGWNLPKDFAPDCGISFRGAGKDDRDYEYDWPVGTNLFSHQQATEMVNHIAGDEIYKLRATIAELTAKLERKCFWSLEDDENMPGTYKGSCGVLWTFTEGGFEENDSSYCPQCGGRIQAK